MFQIVYLLIPKNLCLRKLPTLVHDFRNAISDSVRKSENFRQKANINFRASEILLISDSVQNLTILTCSRTPNTPLTLVRGS